MRFGYGVAKQMKNDKYSDSDWYKRQYIDTDYMTEEEEGFYLIILKHGIAISLTRVFVKILNLILWRRLVPF